MEDDYGSGLGHVPPDILKERAAALGRIGDMLESLLAELAALQAAWSTSADGEERDRLVREHAAVREKASIYRWYLLVQREANGLFDVDELDRLFPLPPPLGA